MNHKVDVIITVYNKRTPEKIKLEQIYTPYHSSTVYEPTESWYGNFNYFDKHEEELTK